MESMESKKNIKPIDGNLLYRIESLLYDATQRTMPDNKDALFLLEQVLFDIDSIPELNCHDCLYEKTHILCDHCARGYADFWTSASLAKLERNLEINEESYDTELD